MEEPLPITWKRLPQPSYEAFSSFFRFPSIFHPVYEFLRPVLGKRENTDNVYVFFKVFRIPFRLVRHMNERSGQVTSILAKKEGKKRSIYTAAPGVKGVELGCSFCFSQSMRRYLSSLSSSSTTLAIGVIHRLVAPIMIRSYISRKMRGIPW